MARPSWLAGLWAGVALLTLSSTLAHAGLFEDEEARQAVFDLRRRVEAVRSDVEAARSDAAAVRAKLEQRLDSGEQDIASLRSGLLNLQSQIQTLRADLAELRGTNEQLVRQISELQQSQRTMLQSLDQRLSLLEPVKVAVDGREFMAEPTEKRDYEAAMDVFRGGDFATAQGLLADFVARYRASGYRLSALFWLGNAQYAAGNCKEAIPNFRALVARDAGHPRAPEAVLSVANCQIELKDTAAARVTLRDLVRAYPASEAAQAAKERLARLK